MVQMIKILHMHVQGLQLPMADIRLSPRLLARLATYASGKAECVKAVTRVLPELCQVCMSVPIVTHLQTLANKMYMLAVDSMGQSCLRLDNLQPVETQHFTFSLLRGLLTLHLMRANP